ncbi:hypothetical protein pb186bvf_000191 [Paramecium bursaria]
MDPFKIIIYKPYHLDYFEWFVLIEMCTCAILISTIHFLFKVFLIRSDSMFLARFSVLPTHQFFILLFHFLNTSIIMTTSIFVTQQLNYQEYEDKVLHQIIILNFLLVVNVIQQKKNDRINQIYFLYQKKQLEIKLKLYKFILDFIFYNFLSKLKYFVVFERQNLI